MALVHKDWLQYDKVYKNEEGRQLICPRCKGGNGASEIAKKKKLKPITDRFCFTCWGWERKRVLDLSRGVEKVQKAELSPKVKTMLTKLKHKRKGRKATIKWTK